MNDSRPATELRKPASRMCVSTICDILDTNVLVSALITRGTPPDQLYQAWLRNDIELVTSAAQIPPDFVFRAVQPVDLQGDMLLG